jgi:hypothetical protein
LVPTAFVQSIRASKIAWCYWALAGYKQSRHVSDHTHTSLLSFACATDKSKAKIKCACKEREHPNCTTFFFQFSFLVRGGWHPRSNKTVLDRSWTGSCSQPPGFYGVTHTEGGGDSENIVENVR